MADITAKMVSELRASTGAGLMDCKKALVEANGNAEEAATILKKKGIASAAKKADRSASEGRIDSYIHLGGKVGVLIEVNCESDFVAKNEDFGGFVKDLCMHIAAAGPEYLNPEDIPAELVEKEKEIAAAQMEGKPAHAMEKIIEGKLKKWYGTMCLMQQPYVKDPDVTIEELVKQKISTIGENIIIKRFARFQIGA